MTRFFSLLCDRTAVNQGLFISTLLTTLLLLTIGTSEAQEQLLPDGAEWTEQLFREEDHDGHRSDNYVTLRDEQTGERITRTGLAVGIGDTYINEHNHLYEIVRVEGNTAYVEFREVVELPKVRASRPVGAEQTTRETTGWRSLNGWLVQARAQGNGGNEGGENADSGNTGSIAIYHSHNAESYVPTSGQEFNEGGAGDVHKVGAQLKDALEEQGLTVHWSEELHLPHDGGAYRRSRATVRELLQKQPVTMLDIHRDAIPAEEYRTEVDGQEMTMVRLVVGRQNQNRNANLAYAKEIKAIADEEFPGLIKGIFNARGNYNQDVGPRMLLLEFGTHETSLEEAQRSAQLMAQVIPRAAGVEGDAGVGAGAWRTVMWLIVAAVGGTLIYLRVNAGSWEAFFDRLQRLAGRLRPVRQK